MVVSDNVTFYLNAPITLGASHSKSLEFLLVPLTKDGGTYFKALTVFLFPKIVCLPFF